MLEIHDLKVSYGVVDAIKGISMHVDEGEIVSLIGANGAGKTTILRAISGLKKAESGEILFDGTDLRKTEPSRIITLRLAHVPEGRHIFAQMTVEENLEMGAFSGGENKAELMEQVYERFPRLKERRRQLAGTLSGGEQQMVAIARGMMCGPKLLMLDEPSLGLMPKLVEEVFSFVQRINKLGTTIVIVEQNVNETLKFADYAYIVSEGEIALHGTPQELMKDDEIRRIYLGH